MQCHLCSGAGRCGSFTSFNSTSVVKVIVQDPIAFSRLEATRLAWWAPMTSSGGIKAKIQRPQHQPPAGVSGCGARRRGTRPHKLKLNAPGRPCAIYRRCCLDGSTAGLRRTQVCSYRQCMCATPLICDLCRDLLMATSLKVILPQGIAIYFCFLAIFEWGIR